MRSAGIKYLHVSIVLAFFLLAVIGFSTSSRASASPAVPTGPVVVRLYYAVRENLDTLANTLDIWEVNHKQAYLLALVSPQRYVVLMQEGYRLEIDPVRTAQLNQPFQPLPGQGIDTIPGYPCYRTVEEDYADMQAIATAHPELATWIDIGDSWEKDHAGGNLGYDIYALRLTNSAVPDPKPTFFLMAEIHAREYTTAETAARFAEYLIANYGIDPDITWLLDYYKVYIVTMTNPDGRKMAEAGNLWRKNTDNDDGCNEPDNWGTDLNRNHSFKWNMGGSSGSPCDETYQGPSAGSEPEVQAIQSYVLTLFPDQRGAGDTDSAPPDATGVLVTLHSYAQLVLWPWGWSGALSPNNTQLQTLGRKLAYFNNYTPQQSYQLYQTSGTSDDWSYGILGIASYTIEMGTDFFQDCGSFETTIFPNNRDALMIAFKSARRPYMEPSGPDTLNVIAIPTGAEQGETVVVSATADDTRFNNSNGTEPTQNIAAAEFYIDTPPWITTATPVAYPMTAADGSFDEKAESVVGTLDTAGLSLGRHTIFVRGQDASGNWGEVSAAFLYILEPGVSPVLQGYVRDASTNQPVAATIKAGVFQANADPGTGFYTMKVINGIYDVTAIAAGYSPANLSDVLAQNYQTIQQDFYLAPTCTIFSDTVENGNQGWTAQSPWVLTAEASHSPGHSWTDSPGGNYGNNRNTSLTSQSFNLSGYTRVALNFWHIYDTEPGYDNAYVEYSTNGVNWTTVATYTGYGHLTWEQQTLPLPGLDRQTNARVRFRFTSDPGVIADGWHIDDISLVGEGAVCNTPLAPTAEFTSSATTVNPGEPVQFTDLTYGTPPFTYQWDFGDGVGTSSEANPSYVYFATGLYTVALTITNGLGNDTVSHPIFVQAGECVPVTQVDLKLVNVSPLRLGDIAHFRASLLPALFTRPVSYTVDYHDSSLPVSGSSSAVPLRFDHTFGALGNYPVSIASWNCAMTVPVTSTILASVTYYTIGMEVRPLDQSRSGNPGDPVTYTLTITNTGEQPDTFSLALVEAAWHTGLPASTGSLAPGASANVLVIVTVDSGAAVGASDTATLRIASSHPDFAPVTATLTTTANLVYNLNGMADTSALDGFPGMPVTFTVHITNTGNTTDTFGVQAASLWDVSVPASIGPLASGDSLTLRVVVIIPPLAAADMSEPATVTISSQGDPGRWQVVTLITTARWNGFWIPLVFKH